MPMVQQTRITTADFFWNAAAQLIPPVTLISHLSTSGVCTWWTNGSRHSLASDKRSAIGKW